MFSCVCARTPASFGDPKHVDIQCVVCAGRHAHVAVHAQHASRALRLVRKPQPHTLSASDPVRELRRQTHHQAQHQLPGKSTARPETPDAEEQSMGTCRNTTTPEKPQQGTTLHVMYSEPHPALNTAPGLAAQLNPQSVVYKLSCAPSCKPEITWRKRCCRCRSRPATA